MAGTKFTGPLKVGVLDAQFPEIKITAQLEVTAQVETSALGFFQVEIITTAGTTVEGRIPIFRRA